MKAVNKQNEKNVTNQNTVEQYHATNKTCNEYKYEYKILCIGVQIECTVPTFRNTTRGPLSFFLKKMFEIFIFDVYTQKEYT